MTYAVTNFWCHRLIAKVNKRTVPWKILFLQSVWGKTHYFRENIKICGWIRKSEAIKMQFVCVFLHICRKFEFSQGSVATWVRWVGQCCTSSVVNSTRFPEVQKFENELRFDKVTGGNVFETQHRCRLLLQTHTHTHPSRVPQWRTNQGDKNNQI